MFRVSEECPSVLLYVAIIIIIIIISHVQLSHKWMIPCVLSAISRLKSVGWSERSKWSRFGNENWGIETDHPKSWNVQSESWSTNRMSKSWGCECGWMVEGGGNIECSGDSKVHQFFINENWCVRCWGELLRNLHDNLNILFNHLCCVRIIQVQIPSMTVTLRMLKRRQLALKRVVRRRKRKYHWLIHMRILRWTVSGVGSYFLSSLLLHTHWHW